MSQASQYARTRSIPEGTALLEGVGLCLERTGRSILEDVSLTVRSGEVVVVIGPNGAGKTSLLRVLLGLWPASGGRVVRRRGIRIGYMPQRVQVDAILPLSVRRFLTLRHRAPLDRLREVLRQVGVQPLLDAPVQTLSGGEMQRVLLARALLSNPDLLVLDEPAQGVDVVGQGEVFDLIDRLRKATGCGVLMVSHELHLVMGAADVVVCVNQHVCCTGRPEEVSRHPEYQRLFPDASVRGIGIYTHHHNHVHDLAGEVHPVGRSEEGPDRAR
ncbi:ATP-binding cassette domain-containing protein [Thioalkalivibrio paradoxus]|uniref:Zinc ABC transporter ATP-binding protein n=1 Tax=Thioalkalivibrio paradoxus ARh 1 TaxID=713585 RepID=W0DP36_9GAMM|nr:ATP-binding cassette domain-containing protein [Thioalkalivibrio paradoxus]AHE98748.1 zinc ABC transporter ATP-binding protein [Thioalkalivibrio paradoxus ARh 1]